MAAVTSFSMPIHPSVHRPLRVHTTNASSPLLPLWEEYSDIFDKTPLPFRKYPFPMSRPHPFAGALHPKNLSWGYVHDPQILHTAQQKNSQMCWNDSRPGDAVEALLSTDGLKVLERIKNASLLTIKQRQRQQHRKRSHHHPSSNYPHRPPRIFCAIYTYQGNVQNIEAITKTWGSRCDGFLAASNHSDPDQGIVHIPHLGAEGSYTSIWQKIRSMLYYVYEHFGNDYDYFHICGDDTFVIVENLQDFLTSSHRRIQALDGGGRHQHPIYAGGPVQPWKKKLRQQNVTYNCGGPGYTLNQAALKLFVQKGLALCHPHDGRSMEDLFMGQCMKRFDNILPFSTSDGMGAARYHQADPNHLLDDDEGLKPSVRRFLHSQRRWRQRVLGEPKDSFQAVSNTTISFHLVKDPNYMYAIDSFLYHNHGDDPLQDCQNDKIHNINS